MSSHAPSYLVKNRFGIYYFRVRIPKQIRENGTSQKAEIRKSLRTSNRNEALRLARIWWVKMANTDFKTVPADIEEIEAAIERENQLLREGRRLYKELERIESLPHYIPSDTENFLVFLSPQQERALRCASEYFSEREQTLNDSSIHTDQIKKDTLTSEITDKITSTFSDKETNTKTNLSTIKLSKAYDDFVSSKLHEWSETTKRKSRSVFNQFIEIVGDINCAELTQELIVEFKTIYIKLPKRTDQGIFKGKSCKEIAGMDIPPSQLQVHNTMVNKLSMILSFLDACEDNFYIDIDHRKPFKAYSKKSKNKGKGSKVRIPYTPEDLSKIFESKEYVHGAHKSAAQYWLPLIALFTGARLNEICQLYKDDIKKSGDIWYFDFNEDRDDKSVKTEAGIRFVPVHPELKRLGLFQYLETITDGERLFPMLKKTQNGYGDSISKWFSRYKKRCDIIIPAGKMMDFHSFRNTLINTLKQKGVPIASAREIVGHEDESLTFGGYANVIDLPNKKKIIEKVNYPSIDFTKIRQRRW